MLGVRELSDAEVSFVAGGHDDDGPIRNAGEKVGEWIADRVEDFWEFIRKK